MVGAGFQRVVSAGSFPYSASSSLADEVSEPPEVKSCVLGYQRPSHTESICLSIPVKLLQRKLPFYPEI